MDASALLALINDEPGRDIVTGLLPGPLVSAVNLTEVITKLADYGLSDEAMDHMLGGIVLEIVVFDEDQAHMAGRFQRHTRHLGLSLGDRACLALARARDLPVFTTDRAWAGLDLGIDIQLIR